jgi:hypothetical protein
MSEVIRMTEPPNTRPFHDRFSRARHELGSLFIGPDRINRWFPNGDLRYREGDVDIMVAKMQTMCFSHLKHERGLLVSGPPKRMTCEEIMNLAVELFLQGHVESNLFEEIYQHARFRDSNIQAHTWFNTQRIMTRTEFNAMNPAELLWVELMQKLERGGKYPLMIVG